MNGLLLVSEELAIPRILEHLGARLAALPPEVPLARLFPAINPKP